MRTEVKAGILVGVIAIAAAIIYISSRTGRTQGEVPMDNPNATASAEEPGPKPDSDSDRTASRRETASPRPGRVQTPPRRDETPRVSPRAPTADRRTPGLGDRSTRDTDRPTRPRTDRTASGTPERTRSPDTMREPDGPTPGTAGLTGPRITPVTPPGTSLTSPEPGTSAAHEPLPARPRVGTPTPTPRVSPSMTSTETPRAPEPTRTQTPTPSPTRTTLPPVTRSTAPATHTVVEGDMFVRIVRDHYGTERHWRAVAAANPDIDPDRIRPGQKIKLPPRETFESATSASPTPRTATSTTPPAGPTTPGSESYTVQEGDRLSWIVRDHYGSERYLAAVVAANPGLNPDRILTGQKITLPPRSAVVTHRATTRPAAPSGRSSDGLTYVVEENDTLTKIAQNTLDDGNRWKEIFELNKDKLSSPDKIVVGMKLKLPPKQR